MKIPVVIACCALGAALAGCHAPPRFDVIDHSEVRHSPDGYALTFMLEATNRNDFELPLLTISYELWLQDERVFEGRRSGEATLRREGAQLLSLPVAVGLGEDERRPAGAVPYRLRGTVRYHTPGALSRSLFDARLVRPSAGFDVRRELEFGAPPPADDGLTDTGSPSAPGRE